MDARRWDLRRPRRREGSLCAVDVGELPESHAATPTHATTSPTTAHHCLPMVRSVPTRRGPTPGSRPVGSSGSCGADVPRVAWDLAMRSGEGSPERARPGWRVSSPRRRSMRYLVPSWPVPRGRSVRLKPRLSDQHFRDAEKGSTEFLSDGDSSGPESGRNSPSDALRATQRTADAWCQGLRVVTPLPWSEALSRPDAVFVGHATPW
jgi:hypothetical protein